MGMSAPIPAVPVAGSPNPTPEGNAPASEMNSKNELPPTSSSIPTSTPILFSQDYNLYRRQNVMPKNRLVAKITPPWSISIVPGNPRDCAGASPK
ncbi:MAG: hypothetical protein Q9184_005262 [Pyrenodesmia sp. 2 TL-2023]